MFVIDTTGSMGKDIAAVQTKTAEIVRETQGTANAPYNYILVTFNDPGTWPKVVSKTLTEEFVIDYPTYFISYKYYKHFYHSNDMKILP